VSARGWINRVCDLERGGRKAEAQELYVANTTPELRARMAEFGANLSKTMAKAMPPPETMSGLGKALVRLQGMSPPPSFEKLRRTIQAIPPEVWEEADEIHQRYKASLDLPEGDPKREAWEIIGGLTPRAAFKFWRHLPDPLKRRGRPKGSGSVVSNEALLLAVVERERKEGIKRTRAAREVLGDVAGVKNKADHIKKVLERKKIEPN
jgi:hypothetical protein